MSEKKKQLDSKNQYPIDFGNNRYECPCGKTIYAPNYEIAEQRCRTDYESMDKHKYQIYGENHHYYKYNKG